MRIIMIVHFMDYRGQFFADINCADVFIQSVQFFYVIGNYSVMFLLHKNAPRG